MSSVRELEDSLPRTAPEPTHVSGDLLMKKYAVYSLTHLDDGQWTQLLQDLNDNEENCGPGNCQVGHQPNLSDHTLLDVYKHHLAIREEHQDYHPDYFIVVDMPDWKESGLLFVCLTVVNNRDETVVGVTRCAVDMAHSIGANLSIVNMDWMDYKEMEQEEWGGENPYENPRYHVQEEEEEQDREEGGKRWKFAWYSAVWKAGPISEMLEPNWTSLPRGRSRFWHRGNFFNRTHNGMLEQVRREHPCTCLVNEDIHRRLLLVAEKENADDEEGMAVYRLDGDLSGFEYDESTYEGSTRDEGRVRAIMPGIELLEKVRAGEALRRLEELVESEG